MQIAAYGATFWATRWPAVVGGNIYISSTEPGRIELIPYDNERLQREWEVFKSCCLIWRHLEEYDPRTAGSVAETKAAMAKEDKQQAIVISRPGPGFEPVAALSAPSPASESVAAIDIAATSPDADGRPRKAQKKATPKAAKPAKTIKDDPKLIPIGGHRGEAIATAKLKVISNLVKLQRRHLLAYPKALAAMERRLNGHRTKAESSPS
jgi:hypothetical protein